MQASVFVSLSISDRVILVVHNDADQAKELLELQDRINNPQISLSLQPEATVTPGTELQLEFQADILPIEAPLPEIQWESSSPDIATVENGILHAQKVGTVTITAICGNAQANCSVSIEIPLQELRIDQEKVSLAVGEALQLTAIPVPEDATNFSAVWTSEDPGVAAVSNDGTVTGISPGTVSITASCGDILRQCTVTVGHHAEVVQLDRESLSLTIGQTYTLMPSIYPSTDLIDTMQFESSNAKVVQVNESGTVIALSVGKAYITFRCGEATTKCLVYVVASTP